MLLAADTHVHLYPCYDIYAAFLHGLDNLKALVESKGRGESGEVLKVLFLTERQDCSFFKGLAEGKCLHPGFVIKSGGDEEALWVDFGEPRGKLLVVAGRQIITKERLEVLGLATKGRIADGRPISQVIEEIHALKGVPVLNWSPGKWFGGRGRVVRRLIDASPAHRFLIGDIGMRPNIWGEPSLMRLAGRRGFISAAGSDPLPFEGEERRIGAFGVIGDFDIDFGNPLSDLRRFLRSGNWKIAGKRDSLCAMLSRQWRNQKARKETKALC